MAMKIVILEDNVDRRAIMRNCLADRFPMFETKFFESAETAIGYLRRNLPDTIAIALDHDLEFIAGSDGRLIDPGNGREVADYLAAQKPVCTVIVHTTNSDAAVGMTMVLRDGGWKTKRVVPFDDMNWIESDWFFAMRRAIVGPLKRKRVQTHS
ncbi:MAG TPA: cyclic-phosphate processing receiver domain-containing protein [Urbifossiella sp.]|jgi:CheY-like chemotaxis protein